MSGRETPLRLPKALGEQGAPGCKRAPQASMQSLAGISQQAWSFQVPVSVGTPGVVAKGGVPVETAAGLCLGCSGNHCKFWGSCGLRSVTSPPGDTTSAPYPSLCLSPCPSLLIQDTKTAGGNPERQTPMATPFQLATPLRLPLLNVEFQSLHTLKIPPWSPSHLVDDDDHHHLPNLCSGL